MSAELKIILTDENPPELAGLFQKISESQNGNSIDPLENDLFSGFEPLKPRDGRPMAPVAPFGGNF